MQDHQIEKTVTRIIVITVTMVALGLVMVSSSSMAFSDHGNNGVFHYTSAHAARVVVGLVLAVVIYTIDIRALGKLSPVILLFGIFLSLLIFVPGLSVDVNGASRWLNIGGFVFQPYDAFKVSYILFLAYMLDRYHQTGDGRSILAPIVVLGITSVLLLMQPDFGSLSLLIGVVMVTAFVVIGLTRYYFLICILLIVTGSWFIVSEPYRLERVAMLMDPWSDRYGAGFQIIQALVAEGSGGITGVGLGQSIQKMLYLPEAHTDFTISVFAEEVGFVGVMLAISLSVYLYVLLMNLSRHLRDSQLLFESYLVFLVSNFIFLQFLFNVSVNYGIAPTKGITLPFMGYGGTSIVSHIVMIGLVLSASRSLLKPVKNEWQGLNVNRSNILVVR